MKYETVQLSWCPTIESIIEVKERVLEKYPSAINFTLEVYEEYDNHSIVLSYAREETPQELEAVARALKKQEELEKATYLRLKKKFGESDV